MTVTVLGTARTPAITTCIGIPLWWWHESLEYSSLLCVPSQSLPGYLKGGGGGPPLCPGLPPPGREAKRRSRRADFRLFQPCATSSLLTARVAPADPPLSSDSASRLKPTSASLQRSFTAFPPTERTGSPGGPVKECHGCSCPRNSAALTRAGHVHAGSSLNTYTLRAWDARGRLHAPDLHHSI